MPMDVRDGSRYLGQIGEIRDRGMWWALLPPDDRGVRGFTEFLSADRAIAWLRERSGL